jgi:hypothetical protein
MKQHSFFAKQFVNVCFEAATTLSANPRVNSNGQSSPQQAFSALSQTSTDRF